MKTYVSELWKLKLNTIFSVPKVHLFFFFILRVVIYLLWQLLFYKIIHPDGWTHLAAGSRWGICDFFFTAHSVLVSGDISGDP